MAKYRTPEEKIKYRKQQRRRKLAMYSCMALFVFVCSFSIIKAVEFFAGKVVQVQKETGPLQQANTDIVKQAENWSDYTGEVARTINTQLEIVPEMSMVQVMETDPVAISYFDDAMFLGDSLADGFKVYTRTGNLALKDSNACYLTQKSTTPRTFLQPGVHVDAGRGPVDVWATIQQLQPKKMYITLGTNALMSMDAATFIDGYYKLIDKIRETSPDTMIYVTTVTPVAAWKSMKEPRMSFDKILSFNQRITKMCVEKDLALINLYDVLKSSSGYLREEIAAGDGYHLTPTGYQQWLDYLITHTVYNPANQYV